MSKSIPDSELLKDYLKREKEDIWVLVKEEVAPMLECLRKFFGSEDKEPSEDFLENTEPKAKSNLKCTRNSTCFPKVTFSKIRKSSSKPSSLKRPKLREKIINFNYRNREENIILKRERENSNKRLKDNRTDNIKIIIDFLILYKI